ncbi:hypothetical protein SNEBB_005172, partial [Seison nebaliae]
MKQTYPFYANLISTFENCMKIKYYAKWFDLMKKPYEELALLSSSIPFDLVINVLLEDIYGRSFANEMSEMEEVRKYFYALMMYEAMNFEEKMVLSPYLEKINLKKILENDVWKLEDNLVS